MDTALPVHFHCYPCRTCRPPHLTLRYRHWRGWNFFGSRVPNPRRSGRQTRVGHLPSADLSPLRPPLQPSSDSNTGRPPESDKRCGTPLWLLRCIGTIPGVPPLQSKREATVLPCRGIEVKGQGKPPPFYSWRPCYTRLRTCLLTSSAGRSGLSYGSIIHLQD